jgi:ribosomal protein S18 acetylase RimI-like enzyme
MAKAKELGYEEMVLDTLSSLETARKLYARLGFVEIEKYYDNPLEMVVYYKVVL